MGAHPDSPARQDDRQAIATSAAAIYAGAAIVGTVEGLLPGGEHFSLGPALAALVLAITVALVGPRAPRGALIVLGPIGVALIAITLATTVGYGDAAIFYTWPMLWMAFWYRRRGMLLSILTIGIGHGLALLTMDAAHASIDRWIDVVAATLVVGLVVHRLRTFIQGLLDQLETEARVDPLTGLLNRRGFELRTAPMAEASGLTLSVVVLDLDHFKAVNDSYGHETGDRVLRWLGTVLREQSRGVDVVARMGGEEFVVLLPRTDAAHAERFAERVRAAMGAADAEARLRIGLPAELQLTVSAGIAAGVAPIDLDALVTAADGALYAAKNAGRDRVRVAA
jgi:diguanylate cyclase (GGDEF)-like protein